MNNSHPRPWPVPRKPWVMKQTWEHLLFAHWKIDIDFIRPYIPEYLEIDTFNGDAWIAVVPFEMRNIRLRYLPEIPFTSSFAEINVRTYVTKNGKPGVYFFSLDAANLLAVQVAKTFFYLPYYYATISSVKDGDSIKYHSIRHKQKGEYEFTASYKPTSEIFFAQTGTLESWLTERYCLYTSHNNKLYISEINHDPWPLQHAEANITCNTMIPISDFHLEQNKPLLHYSKGIDVVLWGLEKM
ncbi:uncharacterized protein YqjF (DUF2071 family) [Metabacillus crassostreae]|uniref:YqjF family protein n=1 Tax=Metabacillus crassostreae TaxID=929098 RepID=UPI001957174D|nr:DUF2071 domain-containing protein [Metabacillus crassostreae]MBM7602659.1 uncharacterized protein YqjF (DUF2071 family) [Metabacillus crassostreae]